ncbi:hypothetical protein Y032_0296g1694 [Ancylostoma ceylanicum]|uniref:Uncharacterized protein n=1 Tax=Ancylostoma ceylanicum TaxID=53326 RepID=A0A016S5R9_9BILA|nr:hypothetical protein Y032_0296g1694 [Ancylostoma ceylanicum]
MNHRSNELTCAPISSAIAEIIAAGPLMKEVAVSGSAFHLPLEEYDPADTSRSCNHSGVEKWLTLSRNSAQQ